jgi:hypothetical protein
MGRMLGRSSTAVRCRALGLVQVRSGDLVFFAFRDCVIGRMLGRNWYQPKRWFETRTAELRLLDRNWYRPMCWYETRTAELLLLGRNWYQPKRWYETRTAELLLVRNTKTGKLWG